MMTTTSKIMTRVFAMSTHACDKTRVVHDVKSARACLCCSNDVRHLLWDDQSPTLGTCVTRDDTSSPVSSSAWSTPAA